jgi:DNA relaxase NicK
VTTLIQSPSLVNTSVFSPYELKSSNEYLARLDADYQLRLDLQAPRLCNTGAQITKPLNGSKIDWLEFTVKAVLPSYAVPEYLGLDFTDFVLADYGMQGYTDCLEFGFVKVLYSPAKLERGTKIILSSQALDEVALDGLEIIQRFLRDGGTPARIDLALDDRQGLFTIDMMWLAELAGHTVSHFQHVAPIERYNRHTRRRVAHGINYGSRTSKRYIRIYDKQLEQIFHGKPDPGKWVRVEMQSNKLAALEVCKVLVDSGLASIPRIVSGALDFRERSECPEKNVVRASRLSWWSAFLGDLPPIRTGVKKVFATIEKKLEWLCTIKKNIGQVCVAFGKDVLTDLVMSGIDKTSFKEWKRLFPDRDSDSFYADIRAGLKPVPF